MKPTGAMIGIDLGIKDLVITSDGDKFENSKTLYKYEKKLAKEQRKLAKRQKVVATEINSVLKLQDFMRR